MTEYRAHFDAVVTFVNGGGLTAAGFRLDVPSADVFEGEVARLFVQHLGLALVQEVRLDDLRIVAEQHRGSRMAADIHRSDRDGRNDGSAERRVVDLSHPVRAGLVTSPGLPAPGIEPHLTREASRTVYAPGTEVALDTITMIGNTGTSLDSPYHRYPEGGDLASLDLATLVGLRAEVLHLTDAQERGIPASVFYDRDVTGAAVLLHTGWDRRFGNPEHAVGAPNLTAEAARYLAETGAALVGIDSLDIDDADADGDGPRPAHSILLAAGIPVVEHLTRLDALPAKGARFTAVTPAVEGFGTFPVRAFAEL